MIRLNVWETSLNEHDLFFKLVARGRHADIPYYFSVESWDLEKGWVIFERLDCSVRQPFRVGVAGNKIIFQTNMENEVARWLKDWGATVVTYGTLNADSPAAVHTALSVMRKGAMSEADREQMNTDLSRRITEHRKGEDADLLERCR